VPEKSTRNFSPSGLGRATDWLNDKLEPVLGAPERTPDDERDPTPVGDRPCPICGQPMRSHPRMVEGGHLYYQHPNESPSNLMESEPEQPGNTQPSGNEEK
jgi:hypothetical protein